MKKVLTVAGSWSSTYHEIYSSIDPSIRVIEVKSYKEAAQPGDAVLLQGGGDISPVLYNQANRFSRFLSPKRDNLELHLLHNATRRGLPVLGVCRGHQMVNVFHGGTLFQDLDKEGVVSSEHGASHPVEYNHPLLERVAGSDWVNSYHHQAVRKVGKGLKIASVSLDGVIEAVYRPGVLGVQWHPESLWETDPSWTELFYWHLTGLRSPDRKLFFVSTPKERIEKSSRRFRIDLERSSRKLEESFDEEDKSESYASKYGFQLYRGY